MARKSTEADIAFVEFLTAVLDKNKLSELEVRREFGTNDRIDVRIRRYSNSTDSSPPSTGFNTIPIDDGDRLIAHPEPMPATMDDPASHPGVVTSPMVGTVYMQAEPGAPTFMSVGSKIEKGDTLLIVEAMKTMNHIPSPQAGTIARIFVEDGTAVEYGTPLVIIE
ncbi:MAG: acetyl-CoA carboxylase biotin carboxyl carrier protein subunit [Aestuariivita sp.]|nr:acetyl-CoA carboxylase biotin carboxyl carrier protein subunit [Aestuariivita sp.]